MKKEVRIGIFTLLMILGAWTGIRFLSGINLFGGNNTFYANYTEVSGVQNSSPVFIHGVKVGNVSLIELHPGSEANVTLEFTISSDYEIPSNSTAEIFDDGLMGGKAIRITMGNSSTMLSSGDTIASKESDGLLKRAETELGALSDKINTLATDLQTTLASLNSILGDNAKHINGMLSNMESLTNSLNSMVDTESGDLSRMVGGLANMSQSLGDNSKSVENILNNLDSMIYGLHSANLGASLTSTLGNIDALTTQLNSKEGSIGLMLHDNTLYDNLTAATSSLDSLLFDMKSRPDRYVNISVFSRDYDKKYAKADKKLEKATKRREKAEGESE